MHGFKVRIFAWNIGGASLELLPEAIRQGTGETPKESVVLLQECPRVAPGWKTVKAEGMVVLSHRQPDQWRGCGIAFDPRVWAPISKKVAGRGLWFAMRHLSSQETFLLGTVHIAPGLTQAEYIQVAVVFLTNMPKKYRRVVIQGDFNAPISWVQKDEGDIAYGNDGKALMLLDLLAGNALQPLAPLRYQQGLPTSRPRQEGRKGSRIDFFASKELLHVEGRGFPDSYLCLNTDHELMSGTFSIRATRVFKRPATGPRVWCGELRRVEGISVRDLRSATETAKRSSEPSNMRS